MRKKLLSVLVVLSIVLTIIQFAKRSTRTDSHNG